MEVKLIQRYSFRFLAANIAAGVYSAPLAVVLLSGPFPIWVNSINISLQALDTVTDQNIEGSYAYDTGFGAARDNPGLVGAGQLDRIVGSFGGNIVQPVYYSLGPSETITGSVEMYLSTVTANIIIARFSMRVGYLCPEDYLSLNAFAASSG